jgi:hypothetical protein
MLAILEIAFYPARIMLFLVGEVLEKHRWFNQREPRGITSIFT